MSKGEKLDEKKQYKGGDRVIVEILGDRLRQLFADDRLSKGSQVYGTVSSTHADRIELDDFPNPHSESLKIYVNYLDADPEWWGAKVVKEDLNNGFQAGDEVTIVTDIYGRQGMRGTVTAVDPWAGIFVRTGEEAPLYYFSYELKKIELPETEPLTEWEKELLFFPDPDDEARPPYKIGDRVRIGLDTDGAEIYPSPEIQSGNVGTITNINEPGTMRAKYGVTVPDFFEVSFHEHEISLVTDDAEEATDEPEYEINDGDQVILSGSGWCAHDGQGSVRTISNIRDRSPSGAPRRYDLSGIGMQMYSAEGQWELTKVEEEEASPEIHEVDGVKTGDKVFILEDALYGLQGTVTSIGQVVPSGPVRVFVQTEDHGTLAVLPGDVDVLPDLLNLEVGEALILGIIREQVVESGLGFGFPRDQIKEYTEHAMSRVTGYLAGVYNDGYEAGRSNERRSRDELREAIRELID